MRKKYVTRETAYVVRRDKWLLDTDLPVEIKSDTERCVSRRTAATRDTRRGKQNGIVWHSLILVIAKMKSAE